jgi:K+-sensing histidine kinase KdpD
MSPRFADPPHALSLKQHLPYLVASIYALATTWGILLAFGTPPPRFMDIYLIGIAFCYARWSLGPALMLYISSLVFAAWILPPRNSLMVSDGFDLYRMFSYSLTCVAVMIAIDYAKSRSR